MAKKQSKHFVKESKVEASINQHSEDVLINKSLLNKTWLPFLLLFLFGALLYVNTIGNEYAVDDTLVITQNKFTQKGFDGIKEIFTTDAFEGFFGERGKTLVAGGRYRPLSIATFAIEIGIFGKNKPAISHLNNALLYGLTIVAIYAVLLLLFPIKNKERWWFSIPFLISLVFAAHPIHTEAIANIKGRDEIMGMLFLMLAIYGAIKYMLSNEMKWLAFMTIAYALALLSKENAITFIAIALLTSYVFLQAKKQQYFKLSLMYAIPTLFFLYIRSSFTGAALSKFTTEIMNDPFTFSTFSEKFGTLFYTYIIYLKLLILPHPLTHDYYPYQTPKLELSSMIAIFSILINGFLFFYAVYSVWKRKDFVGYGLLFYFITFSIVSQVFFTIGTPMSERFVFIPSLGIIIALVLFLKKVFKTKEKIFLYGIYTVAILFSLKTVSRNLNWKNDFTLFTHDVGVSVNSAKLNMATGGALLDSAKNVSDTLERNKMILEAIQHLNTAVEIYGDTSIESEGKTIHIGYANAYNLLGNAYFMLNKDLEKAERSYKIAAYYQPGHFDAFQNLVVIYNAAEKWNESIPLLKSLILFKPNDAGFYYKLGDAYQHLMKPDSAIVFYKEAILRDPVIEAQANYQMGICYAQQKNDIPTAMIYFNKAEKLDPAFTPQILYQIGLTYARYRNDLANGIIFLTQAVEIEPENIHYNEDLGVCLAFSHRPSEAIVYFKKCLKIQPSYQNVIGNMFNAYNELGKTDSAILFRNMLIKKN